MEPGDLVYVYKSKKHEPKIGIVLAIHDWVSNGPDLLYIFYRVFLNGQEIIIAGEYLEALSESRGPGDS